MVGFLKKSLLLLLVLVNMFLTTACTNTIVNCADELVSHSYSATLDNGNVIKLQFSDDNAILKIVFADKTTYKISGFCEVSESQFVIHDSATLTPYVFEYIVHFDSVDVIYEGNTVCLHKT